MRPSVSRVLHSPRAMVLVAFLVRFGYVLITGCYRFDSQYWSVFEMAALGRSLATGSGFSLNPQAGPSAWTAPLYPCVLALSFRLFGVFSHAAGLAVLIFNSVFAALTCWTIYRIAQRVFDETVAAWSGWIWAFLPNSIYFSAYWPWETTLSAFLLSLLFLLTLQMEQDSRLWSWCRYGVFWGVVALTNTSALSWLPFAGCWLAYKLYQGHRRFWLPVIVGSLAFWITLSPWLIRNTMVFGAPLIRGDFGAELRAGNNSAAQGWWVAEYTYNNPVFRREYDRLGESAYVSLQRQRARRWIAENPQRFLVVSCHRFIYFWAGIPHAGFGKLENVGLTLASLLSIGGLLLALKRQVHAVFLFTTLILVYPLVYYITFPTPRYRHAIEPELLILSVFLLLSARPPWRAPSPQ